MKYGLKNVTKVFPGVKALDNVSMEFHSGEIHALLGENGAGKSTAIKVMCGIYNPDSGSVYMNDKNIVLNSYNDAILKGVSIVHQEIQVVPTTSVAENILLDKISKVSKRGLLSWKNINQIAQKYMDIVGLKVSPSCNISQLSAAQKQMVQIARALSSNSKVIFFDEPTSSLTSYETEKLFEIIRKLKKEGKVIIFISHKLEEVLDLCDKVSILRDGQYVGTSDCKGITKDDLIMMMIGRSVETEDYGRLDIKDETVLEVRNICQKGRFENISFALKRGEILGLYGLVGAGRSEIAKIIIGADKADSGQIFINGKEAHIHNVSDSVHKYKLGYVSENRKEDGLILQASIKTNIAITLWEDISKTIFKVIDLKKETNKTNEIVDKFRVKIANVNQNIEDLSGGNQQKICIGKWIAKGCDIIIIDEPTVGVDVGAKEVIHQLIWNLAKNEGKSVILISSDMPELCSLARRILVFKDFKINGEISDINDRFHTYEELSPRIGTYLK